MSKNGTRKSAFDIQDQSIVVAAQDEGSVAMMKKIAKEHGDTAPQKLEKRRERLSSLATLLERDLKQLQMSKKVYLLQNQKKQDEVMKKMKPLPQDGKDFIFLSERLAEMVLERQLQEQQYELLIGQKITNMGMIEGLCLLVDCMTLREPVKSKSGKVGQLRFSSALYNCDAAYYAGKTYRRLKKLCDTLIARDPLLAGALAAEPDDDDEEDGEETTYDDEDVVTDDERKKIKEAATSDDLGGEL